MKALTILGCLVLLAFSTSLAQDDMNHPSSSGGPGARLRHQLKLTDDQRKHVDDLRFELRKKSVEQQAKIKTARLEVAELFRADQPNQSAIQKKVAEISQLQSAQRLLVVDHWFAVNKLLTPEQQKIWKKASGQLLAQQRARFIRGRAAAMMRNQRSMQRSPRPSGAMGR